MPRVKTPGPALVRAAQDLNSALEPLAARKAPEASPSILNPLAYAWRPHKLYLERHARAGIEALFIGMNPGPWGMGQTGVPFGDPAHVRDFLGITGKVDVPANAHERCPVLGLDSPRGEVSGQRIWGGVKSCFGDPAPFFERFFVANYCPLLFLSEKGANVTPDKLPAAWMEPVLEACDEHLREMVRILQPKRVLGVGAWATKRATLALEGHSDATIGTILHPSPASPLANKGWLAAALKQLDEHGCPWPRPR
jgi:single-strand selective monofunctional uracil DNA glycosylase